MPRKKYTFFDEFELRGEWWLPGKAKQSVPGILRYSSSEIVLDLFGTFHSDALQHVLSGSSATKELDTVLGRLEDGQKCTLYDLIQTHFNANQTGARCAYSPHFLLLGFHLDSEAEQLFSVTHLSLTNLEDWLNQNPFSHSISESTEDGSRHVQVSYTQPAPVEFSVPALDGTVSLCNNWATTQDGLKSRQISREAFLKVEPRVGKPLKWHLTAVSELARLLTLLTAEPIRVRRLGVHPVRQGTQDSSQEVDVFYRPIGRNSLPGKASPILLFCFPAVSSSFASILDKWLARNENFTTAKSLFISTVFAPGDFLEPRFLTLTQAIESYSRFVGDDSYLADDDYEKIRKKIVEAIPTGIHSSLRAKLKSQIRYGNEVSLRKRIDTLLDSLQPDTVALLTDSPETFREGIIATRNHLTHHSDDFRGQAIRGVDLHWACERLKMLLRILLLRECEIPEEDITNAIMKHPRLKQEIGIYKEAKECEVSE